MEAAARSGIVGAFIAGVFLASCAGPAAQPVAPAEPPVVPPAIIADTPPAPQPVAPPPPAPTLACSGPATQGGAILCTTLPNSTVSLDGSPTARAGADGIAIVGLTRSAPTQVKITARPPGGGYDISTTVDVLPRHDTVTSFQMECGKIAPQSADDKR